MLLIVGKGEKQFDALRAACVAQGLSVETASTLDAVRAVRNFAPDLVLLSGDAAIGGGQAVLRLFSRNAQASVVPVAVLADAAAIDSRANAFRHGVVAMIAREANVNAMAERISQVARELPDRQGETAGAVGEGSFDELVTMLKQELRTGILIVSPAKLPTPGVDAKSHRIVLGAGKPLGQTIDTFIAELRKSVDQKEPLRFEFQESSAARLRVGDEKDLPDARDEGVLKALRILLVSADVKRSELLATALRSHGSTVATTDVRGFGFAKARTLDPEVVLIDRSGLDGPAFDIVKDFRRDLRLRWASMLVLDWEAMWPDPAASMDVQRLASRIAPLVEPDRSMTDRARIERSFEARLEVVGPSRLLRSLGRVDAKLHVTIRNLRAMIECDIENGTLLGAICRRTGVANAQTLQGQAALSALLAIGTGRVRVEKRVALALNNVQMPVADALADAADETPPLAPSAIPPAILEKLEAFDPATNPPPAFSDVPRYRARGEDDIPTMRVEDLAGRDKSGAPNQGAAAAAPIARVDISQPANRPLIVAQEVVQSRAASGDARASSEAPPSTSVIASGPKPQPVGSPTLRGPAVAPAFGAGVRIPPSAPTPSVPSGNRALVDSDMPTGFTALPDIEGQAAAEAPPFVAPSDAPTSFGNVAPSDAPTSFGNEMPDMEGSDWDASTTAHEPSNRPLAPEATTQLDAFDDSSEILIRDPAAKATPRELAPESTTQLDLNEDSAEIFVAKEPTRELSIELQLDPSREISLPNSGGPDPLDALVPSIPPPLRKSNPEQQQPVARAAEPVLAPLPQESSAPVLPPAPVDPEDAASVRPVPKAPLPLEQRQSDSRRRMIKIAAGVAALLVVAGIAWTALQPADSSTTPLAAETVAPKPAPVAAPVKTAEVPLKQAVSPTPPPAPTKVAEAPPAPLPTPTKVAEAPPTPPPAPTKVAPTPPPATPTPPPAPAHAATPTPVAVVAAATPAGNPDAVATEGEHQLADGHYAEAEAAFRSVIAADAHNPHGLAGLARVALHKHDLANALHFAESAVRARPKKAVYRVLLGDVQQAVGNGEGARASWQAALEAEPGNADATRRLGR